MLPTEQSLSQGLTMLMDIVATSTVYRYYYPDSGATLCVNIKYLKSLKLFGDDGNLFCLNCALVSLDRTLFSRLKVTSTGKHPSLLIHLMV